MKKKSISADRAVPAKKAAPRPVRTERPSPRSPRNPFFLPPSESLEERKRGRLLAALEIPELAAESLTGEPESEPVLLECVDAAWVEATGWLVDAHPELYGGAPLFVLELRGYPLDDFSDARPGQIVWFEVEYERCEEKDADALIYASLFSAGSPVRLGPPRYTDSLRGNQNWARRMTGASEEARRVLRRTVRGVLGQLGKHESAGVAIYDVGQGSCQALLDAQSHIPLLYVDLGGGVLTNMGTFPPDFRGLCFTRRPMVVLSHWDWDHWSSACRFPEALEMYWVTPPVPDKPVQRAFAAELYWRGHLLIWDDGFPAVLQTDSVRVELCTGETSNDSGLAVTFYGGRLRRRSCLLPGDAGYEHIPSVAAAEKFNALCMTHHGGRLHSAIYPVAKRGAASANSSGPRNSYRHPLFSTLKSHLESGWSMPFQTGFSGQRPCHVLLPWGEKPHLFKGACRGQKCALAPSDVAPRRENIALVPVSIPAKPVAKRRIKAVKAAPPKVKA